MKKYMPFNGLRWSRDSGSALYDTPQTAVFGRAGGEAIDADRRKDTIFYRLVRVVLIAD